MGMFDTVTVNCPECQRRLEFAAGDGSWEQCPCGMRCTWTEAGMEWTREFESSE